MNLQPLIGRLRNQVLNPAQEWQKIASEPQDIRAISLAYLLPLTLLVAICILTGSLLFRDYSFGSIVARLLYMGVSIPAAIFISSWVINKIAPNFETSTSLSQVFVTVCYAAGPAMIIWSLSELAPYFGFIKILALYALYQYQLGVTVLIPTDSEHRPLYWASGCFIALVWVWFCFIMLKNLSAFLW